MNSKYTNKNQKILFYVALFIIFILGFYLRLYAINHTYVDIPLRADAGDYYSYAYNMNKHGTYSNSRQSMRNENHIPKPDALRSPGFPFLVSIIAGNLPTNQQLLNITLFNGFLSVITLLLTYKIASSAFPLFASFLIALFASISPHLINSNIYILTESLFTFLLVSAIWLSMLFLKNIDRKRLLFLIGIIIGLGTLTRPSLQYFIIPLMLFFIYKQKQSTLKQKKNTILLMLFGFAIVVSPWHVRNYISTGELSNDTLIINGLHHGMYPDFKFKNQAQSYAFPYRFDPKSKEVSKSVHSIIYEIINRFKTEPARHLKWYFIDKPITFFSWNIIQGMGESFIYPIKYSPYFDKELFIKSNEIMRSLHYPIVILAVIASILIWIPFFNKILPSVTITIAQFLSLVLFYFILVHIIVAPFPRYSVPLRPVLYIMSMIPIFMLYNFMQQKKSHPTPLDN